jgi:iron complex transport system ATP-binding protein
MRDGHVCHTGTVSEIIQTNVLHAISDMHIKVQEIDGRRVSLFYE